MPSSPEVHTYHCICSTLLLASPYALSTLPQRALPAVDEAYILPLPPLTSSVDLSTDAASLGARKPLPSLIGPQMRPGRKVVVVRREDGFEKRRLWRCGRCGVGVGYEIVQERDGREEERVVYLLKGGLVETEGLGGIGEEMVG